MRVRMHRLCFLLAAVFAAGMWASTASAITIIDHFDQPPMPGPRFEAAYPGPLQVYDATSGLNVIGGTRETTLSILGQSGIVDVFINSASFGGSVAAFSDWPGTVGRVLFEYRDLGNMNVDLSHETQFVAQIVKSDHPGGTLSASVNGSAPVSVAIPVGGLQAIIPFSSPAFAGVDFHHVTDLKFQIDGPEAYQVELDYFAATSIPAPMAAWAGGALLGLLAFAKVRRLKRS